MSDDAGVTNEVEGTIAAAPAPVEAPGAGSGVAPADSAAAPAATAPVAPPVVDGKKAEAAAPVQPPVAAPAEYSEFTLPEGFTLDDVSKKEITDAARANNLTQEQAQKYVEGLSGSVKTLNDRAAAARRATGEAALRADPEFGGANFDETLKAAQSTVRALGGDALVAELGITGLGNSPELVKALAKLARDGVAGGKFVAGGNARNGGEKSAADILFPSK